jgi:Lecithin retinol acyltransferase
MRASRTVSVEERWRKFLSLVSPAVNFAVPEVVFRARSRAWEDRYRPSTNNCEHLCEWCLRGKARTLQVEAWRAGPRNALIYALRLIAQPRSPIRGKGREIDVLSYLSEATRGESSVVAG